MSAPVPSYTTSTTTESSARSMDALPCYGPNPKWMTWLGYLVAGFPSLLLMMSGILKVTGSEAAAGSFKHVDFPFDTAFGIGVVELVSVAFYVWPRTNILGAVLLTGYLGGAIAAHVRIHDLWIFPALLGVMVWGGLTLRDPWLRYNLPYRFFSTRSAK